MCDEAVSALDVSVQSQIVNLLLNLQREMNLAIIFIAHDLSVVKAHLGQDCGDVSGAGSSRLAEAQALYLAPRHPYTQALISAIPVPDPRRRSQRILLTGMYRPHLAAEWLPFSPALPHATDLCRTARPPFEGVRRASGGLPFPLARAGGGATGKGDMIPAPATSQPASLQGGTEEAQ